MRKSNSVKLSDIAEKTGVSQSTVSRVLNNQPGISDATRGAVLSKLREFGYKAEAFDALNPGSDGCMRIDVVICPLFEQKTPLGMEYYTTVIDSIRNWVDEKTVNLRLTMATAVSSKSAFRHNATGVLLVGTPSQELIEQLHALRIPFVILSNNPPDSVEDLVTTDKFEESLRVCNYLSKRGIRRIGLMIPDIDLIYSEGFRCGAARYGMELREEDIRFVSSTDNSSYLAPIQQMFEAGALPEALIFASYDAAFLCEEMLKLRGLRIPDSLLLAAFTDYRPSGDNRFVTIRFDTPEMSRLAIERLLHKIEEPSRPSYRIVMPMQIYDISQSEN